MKSFREFLLKDPLRKVIALSLTVVLYLALNEGKKQKKDIPDVPLEIEGGADVFLPHSSRSGYVRLTVRGSESRVKRLEVKDIVGKVRVTGSPAAFNNGTLKLHLAPEHFHCPRGIEVIAMEPAVLNLSIQRQISRDVPVKPEITGTPQQGRVVAGIRCFPERVTVTGPEKAVQSLREICTEPLSIDGEVMTFDKEMRLINPMPGEYSFDTSSTNISVTIAESPDVPRKFANIPVRYLASPLQQSGVVYGLPDQLRVSVTLTGPQSVINRITGAEITVFADVSDSRYAVPGEHQVPLRVSLNLPDSGNVRVTGIVPDRISFKVKSAEQGKK